MAAPATAAAEGVRPAEDADFEHFKAVCDATEGWEPVSSKKYCSLWMQKNSEESDVVSIKLHTEFFADVPASTLFDVLMDDEYYSKWDDAMAAYRVVREVCPRSRVIYYAAKMPTPLKDRDWVNLKAWRSDAATGEHVIVQHSVKDELAPAAKGYVRANARLVGYIVRPRGDNGEGCSLTYYAHNEWAGSIPAFLVNFTSKTFAPNIVKQLYKACKEYPEWKNAHNPESKPWRA
eukprot:m51a1_g6307 hypothetical protein (234) ;mRNA; r:318392-319500